MKKYAYFAFALVFCMGVYGPAKAQIATQSADAAAQNAVSSEKINLVPTTTCLFAHEFVDDGNVSNVHVQCAGDHVFAHSYERVHLPDELQHLIIDLNARIMIDMITRESDLPAIAVEFGNADVLTSIAGQVNANRGGGHVLGEEGEEKKCRISLLSSCDIYPGNYPDGGDPIDTVDIPDAPPPIPPCPPGVEPSFFNWCDDGKTPIKIKDDYEWDWDNDSPYGDPNYDVTEQDPFWDPWNPGTININPWIKVVCTPSITDDGFELEACAEVEI